MFDFPNAPTANQIVQGPNGATWQWDGVKWIASGLWQGAIVIVSDTAPTNPPTGALWWDSIGGQLYLNYQDPTSREWVIANSGGIYDAPADGSIYTRQNHQWINATASIAAGVNNTGRNLLHNPRFDINQRGIGPFTVSGYSSDRWKAEFATTGGSMSTTINPVTAVTSAANFPDETCKNILVVATSPGTAAAGDYMMVRQFMEDVRRLSGRTVTLSFWAWANSGTPKIGIEFAQQFGNGGSPSAGVVGIGMQAITISTAPTRYVVTIQMPSVAGKTLGTNVGTDFTEVNWWLSSGSTYNATRAAGVGVQTNTFLFWGMQLEYGSLVSSLSNREAIQEYQLCQRYYQVWSPPPLKGVCASGSTGVGRMSMELPVPMRVTPTTVLVSPLPVYNGVSPTTINSIQTSYNSPSVIEFDGNISGSAWSATSGAVVYQGAGGSMTFSADL